MDQSYITIFALTAVLVLALLYLNPWLRRLIYYLTVGPPNLLIEDLPQILNTQHRLNIVRDPHQNLPGIERMQAYNSQVSISYIVTEQAGNLSETVSIAYRDKCGMILTLVNNKVECLDRVGGRTHYHPILSAKEQSALTRFMYTLRNVFKEA